MIGERYAQISSSFFAPFCLSVRAALCGGEHAGHLFPAFHAPGSSKNSIESNFCTGTSGRQTNIVKM
jgi:hypothetical protein